MRPLLVIVSGPPGAGKTTLARRLGPVLGTPVIAKDDIKESLFASLGWSDRAWSRKLGSATWGLLFLLVDRFMEAGTSVLLESNFDRGLHAEHLSELARRHGAVLAEVHCTADVETLSRRYRERETSGERHPGHEGVGYKHDDAGFAAEIAERRHVPLGVATVTVEVDTTSPEQVILDDIVARIREAQSGSEER